MVKRVSVTTKLLILNSAERLFADKGFDGTGMNEIADDAKVPKSLIYYYFSSKDEILRELIKRLQEELIDLKRELREIMEQERTIRKDGLKKLLEKEIRFIEERKNIYKIVLQEGLKNKIIGEFLLNLQVSDQVIIDYLKESGVDIKEKDLKLGHFFLLAIPSIFFGLNSEQWCGTNRYNESIAYKKIIDLLSDISLLAISRGVVNG